MLFKISLEEVILNWELPFEYVLCMIQTLFIISSNTEENLYTYTVLCMYMYFSVDSFKKKKHIFKFFPSISLVSPVQCTYYDFKIFMS